MSVSKQIKARSNISLNVEGGHTTQRKLTTRCTLGVVSQVLSGKQQQYYWLETPFKPQVRCKTGDMWKNQDKSEVYTFLNKREIFIQPDLCLCNDAIVPGKVICIHPKMIQKEDFKVDIQEAIAGHVPPNNSIAKQRYTNNRHKIEGMGAKVPPPLVWEYLLKNLAMKRTRSKLPRSKFYVLNKIDYI
eukprot:1928862-Ditylum_brightwellii.AAC.1